MYTILTILEDNGIELGSWYERDGILYFVIMDPKDSNVLIPEILPRAYPVSSTLWSILISSLQTG